MEGKKRKKKIEVLYQLPKGFWVESMYPYVIKKFVYVLGRNLKSGRIYIFAFYRNEKTARYITELPT